MRRGEAWWAALPAPAGRRPVVLLSRDEAYAVRDLVAVAPVTTRIRRLPVEVELGPDDGLPKTCVANLDTIITIALERLEERISLLPRARVREIDRAIRFALGLGD